MIERDPEAGWPEADRPEWEREAFRPLRAPEPGARRPAERRSFLDDDDEPRTLAFVAPPALKPDPDRAFAVIPCLNEAEHIEGLIRHLLADPDWRDPLVVVADGGSTDGSPAIVQAMAAEDRRIRLVENPRRLQSSAVNLAAARFGRGRRWMVRVDAHAGYPQAYVSRLVKEGRRTGAASVVVAMDTVGHGGFQSAAAAAQNSVLGAGGAAHRCGSRSGWVDHGHHALFDLEQFFGAGGYDETFRANEDAEFDVRLHHNGGRVWLSGEVRVTYYPRDNPRALFRQYLNYGRGRARTLLRHRLRPKLRQMLPVAVAPAAILAPFGLFEPPLALPAAAWIGGCLGLGALLGLKARSRAAIGSGVAAAVMHLAWSIGFWQQLLRGAGPRQTSASPIAMEGRQS
jgi:succinoglycan biosynthesis protein ExoA